MFEVIVCEWYQLKVDWWLLCYCDEIIDIFEKDIFFYIGKCFIVEIKLMELLEVLCKMEKCGVLEKMCKVCQCCGEVFCYVIVIGWVDYNLVFDFVSVLVILKKVYFFFFIVNEFFYFFNDLVGYTGSIIIKIVIQIIMLIGV